MDADHDPGRPRPDPADVEAFGEDPEPSPLERGTATAEDSGGLERAVEQLIEETGLETQPQPLSLLGGLRGKAAIVTGGSSGIGRAVALDLARCGVRVAFCFLDEGSGTRVAAQRVVRELRQLEVAAFCEACDVRDPLAVNAFVRRVREELGGLHILVNNAGIGRDGALWRMEDLEWDVVMRTNVDGAFYFTRACAPHFREQEYGKIVNVASVHGVRPEFGIANYATSKAGLIGLTRSTAVELGPRNVNVNAVAPSYIRTTRLTDRVPAEILDRARERSVLGRLGDPQDVSSVVLFLCSEAARHITGAVIPVDGGYLL
ncbi:MAG: 3-oxoacyl-ACP reductase family protein [Gemmatimonadota bacterium]|jgi:3-oxoacyl-[acyl-carrier protein] reductase